MRKLYLSIILLFAISQISFGQIANGNFESWTSGVPDGWTTIDEGITVSEENSTIHGGSASASVEVTTSDQEITDFRQTISVTNGVKYAFSVFVFHTEGNLKARFYIDGFHNYSQNSVTSSWQEITYVYLATTTGTIEIGLRFYDQDGFDGSEIVYVDDYTMTVVTPDPEPSNHVTAFTASANGSGQIDLTWTDATGTQLPAGYLIKSSTISSESITAPVDGTPETDGTDMSDGSGAINITYGIELYNWIALTPSTNHYYKIYPYTNSGTDIDYKVDGTVPQATATTDVASAIPSLVISEIMQNPDFVSDTDGEWFEIYNPETFVVDIDGYTIKDNGTDSHLINNGGSLNIPAGGFIVLGRNSDALSNGGLTVDYQYSGFLLGNTDDEVILIYSDGTTIVDEVWYDDGSTFPDPTGASMLLTDMTFDNNTGSNWSTAMVREGTFDAVGTDFGSPGTLGTEAVLPVELTSFTATAIAKGVMLNWSTATEVNNYGFSVERKSSFASQNESGDSFYKWQEISFIEGHGNSNSPKDYSFIDNSLIFGDVSYRLKQIDIDGAFEYSDVVTVTATNLAKYELYQNHPNPFNPSTIINFTLPEITHVKITVYNSIGQKVKELLNKVIEAGYHTVEFDGSDLSSGFYIYRLETPNYSKTMKMILLR